MENPDSDSDSDSLSFFGNKFYYFCNLIFPAISNIPTK